MPMTVVVTRDVERRYRGFLSSVMLEVAPGVYVAPDLSAGVRSRVWTVLEAWHEALGRGAVVIIWREPQATGALEMRMLGEPPKEIVDADGVLLVKRQ
jgi:CRISPR-associated protein Cas2